MNNDEELSIYNVLGQKVVTLVSEKQRRVTTKLNGMFLEWPVASIIM